MYEPLKHEGIFLDYKSLEDLLYKEIYSNNAEDKCYVNLYHKGKFVNRAYVWCDGELFGREYISINHTVIYLDTLKTLAQPRTLIDSICDKYNVTFDDLRSESKEGGYAEPRNILYYILRDEYGMTYQAIADMFHRLSHATVMSGCKKIRGYMEVGDRYRKHIESLILIVVNEESDLQVA